MDSLPAVWWHFLPSILRGSEEEELTFLWHGTTSGQEEGAGCCLVGRVRERGGGKRRNEREEGGRVRNERKEESRMRRGRERREGKKRKEIFKGRK